MAIYVYLLTQLSGGSICGAFLVFGVLSYILYKPWRARVEKKRALLPRSNEPQNFATDFSAETDLLGDIEPAPIERVNVESSPKR